ncbi:MAG: FGGY family carbohydrate kinase, partial [bacterium]|nr:FGGY family carbohydrate kinase [bacterium]
MVGRALVAGVDSSTQSTKVELRELDSGLLIDRTSAPHTHSRWEPPVSEQDPATWWEALSACFAQFTDADRANVVAVSVAGQQHGLVLVGEDGEALRPAKLWNDTTSAPQARDLVARYGREQWAQRCGSVPLASLTIAKLAWVLEHEPELADRIAQIMLPHDWLTWRLTGAHVTDRGDASGTGWFDPAANETAPDLLGLAVGDPNEWLPRLPRVLEPDQAAGPITPQAAAALGVSDSVLVG